jgi:hypothetical protein
MTDGRGRIHGARARTTYVRTTYESNKSETVSPGYGLGGYGSCFCFSPVHVVLLTCIHTLSYVVSAVTSFEQSDVGRRMIFREGKKRHGCEGTNLLKRGKGNRSKDRYYYPWVK